MQNNENMVKFLKAQYPTGTRIRLERMNDPYAPVPSGTMGTVDMVDDACTVHMIWDNGRSLGLVPGEDVFSIVQPELSTLKLYMPLTVHCYERDEYGSFENYPDDRDGRYALPFKDQILGLIKRFELPEEAERGLMQWYREQDSVNEKVLSARPTVEAVDGKLMGVMVCRVKGELTTEERGLLDDYITGQMSDGFGESLEQREIKTDDGEIYVSFWNNGNSWKISTAEELNCQQNQEQSQGMEMCM